MKRILLLGIFLYFLGAVGIAHNPTHKNSLKQEDKVHIYHVFEATLLYKQGKKVEAQE